MKKIFTRFVIFTILIALNAIAATFGGAVGCGGGGNSSPLEPNISDGDEVVITTFDGTDPYLNVNEFVGDTFKDKDPDYQWLAETKQKLDSMPAGQYISIEEYNEIIQRQTEIQYKFDLFHKYQKELEENRVAFIDPHTAVEFSLASFCLNISLKIPVSGSLYNEVVPIEEHIEKIFEWYYSKDKKDRNNIGIQDMIWDVQNYVHNGYDYNNAIDISFLIYLDEIFGGNAEEFLQQMKAKYGVGAFEAENSLKYLSSSDKQLLYLAKHRSQTTSISKEGSENNNVDGYFYLGNGLIGRFFSKSSYWSAKLEVINNTDKPLKFNPLSFMLKQKEKNDYQSIALGADAGSSSTNFSNLPKIERDNQSLNPQTKLAKKPTCNITDAHRQRVLELAHPDNWQGVPYQPKNSREGGVVCNQYVWIVYSEAGLDYPEVNVRGLLSSPFFEEIDKNSAKNGDMVVWFDNNKNIHHVGIWVENPEAYGGNEASPVLSARLHREMGVNLSELPTDDPKFIPTVDWTGLGIFDKDDYKDIYTIYQFKGAGSNTPNCPLK